MIFLMVTFLYVIDADTLKVTIPDVHPLLGKKISIRLKSVDGVEKRCDRARWESGKIFVRKLLQKKDTVINLSDCSRGKYFRLVCNVTVNGNDLATMLLWSGHVLKYGNKFKCVQKTPKKPL